MTSEHDIGALKGQLVGLFQYVTRVREEIAAINRPADGEHHFEKMSDQLDAIVEATDKATNTIMEKVEKNEALLTKLRKGLSDAGQQALIDQISVNDMAVIEACSFQDLTGQRITKVVKSLAYVEDRVNALIEIWGRDEVEKVDVKPEQEKTEDEKLLHGPQRAGEGISQAEIDKLFE